jgi:hypothetical protein
MLGAMFERSQEEFQWKRNWERLEEMQETLNRLEKQSGFLVKNTNNIDEGAESTDENTDTT